MPRPAVAKPPGRLIELDILRGFLLVWMTLTHLPTKASVVSNQTFGFVSGAEGFIFLSAFMVGQLQHRMQARSGAREAAGFLMKRTARIYIYHCALLAIAFTVFAYIGTSFHRLAIENLLSFYLSSPKQATIAAALLAYRPALLDILPLYVIFMLITAPARRIARRWGWDPILFVSFSIWAGAQFGLRAWVYRHVNLFGLAVPESSTGAFDVYAWQMLWIAGIALGDIYADSVAGLASERIAIPAWLLRLSIVLATVFFVLRYSAADQWVDQNVYGWLIDKWHLGPARVINFAALSIVLVKYGARIARLPFLVPLASLGQASIEVFCAHVLCCLGGDALSRDADPNLPWWEQVILLTITLPVLFLTAAAHRRWIRGKRGGVRVLGAPG